ncbi:MAG: hypothetical protein ACI9WU_002893, partial [Myxococcota bacterium]
MLRALINTIPLVFFVLTGCGESDPETGLSTGCLITGECACLTSTDCAPGATCVNGGCVAASSDVATSDIDQPDLAVARDVPDVSADIAPDPGAFLAPCTGNEDCDSGKCLTAAEGPGVCTRTCVDDCPPGWDCKGLDEGGDLLTFWCLPRKDRLCEPCASDAACTGADNLCFDINGALACGADCSTKPCPGGYGCQDVLSVQGVEGRQCVPETGACQCSAATAGTKVACSIDNDAGSCPGARTCLDDGSLSACDAKVPEVEQCDELDNDCDGFTDEGLEQAACSASNDFGTCPGNRICLPGAGEVCNAPQPQEEACDNLDNDCDGLVDENFKADGVVEYTTPEHCGACGNDCSLAFANVASVLCDASGDAPACAIETCVPGFSKVSDTLCIKLVAAVCEPCLQDSDCPGPSDKCIQLNPTDQQSVCARDCSDANVYAQPCPAGFTCQQLAIDGVGVQQCLPDNNSCDCLSSNSGQKKPCAQENALGVCFGTAVCDPEAGWTGCSAATPTSEACDGQDNDCDGLVDEELSGGPCQLTNPFGTCTGTVICKGVEGSSCTAPAANEDVCDGQDNDCDGETDQGFAVNVVSEDGATVGLVYSLDKAHCGGCGIPCGAQAPVAAVDCQANDGVVSCAVLACDPGFYAFQGKTCLPVPSAGLCLPCSSDGDCPGPDDQCLIYADGTTFCGRDCSDQSIYGTECPDAFVCDAGQCRRESNACDCDVDGKVRACTVANQYGSCSGLESCITTGPTAGWQGCDALPAPEVCDGADNDCDGLVDAEDDSIDVSGLAGFPGCQKVSDACTGEWACTETLLGHSWRCNAQEPFNEQCNGLDDDCDGLADEDFTDLSGTFSTVAHCGQCGLDCTSALANLAAGPNAVGCLDSGSGFECVPLQCASGFIPFPPAQPAVCLALTSASCRPCSVDEECGPAGHQCLPVGEDPGTYCGQECGADAPWTGCTGAIGTQDCCGEGFVCQDTGAAGPVCKPTSDTCQCTAANAGLTRPCTASAGGKTCFGEQTCSDSGGGFGWSGCDTSANIEVCDGQDNDCDGLADEPFLVDGKYAQQQHCGACGKSCDLVYSPAQHATATCDATGATPVCSLSECTSETLTLGAACLTDADCAAGTCLPDLFFCSDGPGVGPVVVAFTNLDQEAGNGCECPAAASVTLDTPEQYDEWPAPGALYVDRNCDGVDGDVQTALFVRPGGNGAGTINGPLGSIQAAIDAFDPASHNHILVAGGIYDEGVTIKAGVRLHGGYTQDFSGRDIVLQQTTIRGQLIADGITKETLVTGFELRGPNIDEAGVASVAVRISASTEALRIVGNRIVGGQGGPGQDGAAGTVGVGGNNGTDGNNSQECV